MKARRWDTLRIRLPGLYRARSKEVRLLSLCDVFSALTSERAYKPAYTQKQALRILQNGVYSPFKSNHSF